MKTATFNRLKSNPLLSPNPVNLWEAKAVFNPCVVGEDKNYHLLYRAVSKTGLSTVGYAFSEDGLNFSHRRRLIYPENDWEKFGCEDPRVTKIGDKYFIFYTALSGYPFSPENIKVGLAITGDFISIEEKHLITPFNAKAMVLFPEKINGQWLALLTANTDLPPATIGLASFTKLTDLWSGDFWHQWYQQLDKHALFVSRLNTDLTEIGAPPVKTKDGWLLIYSHIRNYYDQEKRIFGVEALLLDLNNPQKIIGRSQGPLLEPQAEYEINGMVKNIVFPSGAMVKNNDLFLYYGAADNYCAAASQKWEDLNYYLLSSPVKEVKKLKKYSQNPLLTPNLEQPWQSKAVFNPAVFFDWGKFYLFYRALAQDNTSTIGCAFSLDGMNFDYCSNEPVYVPRMNFEQKKIPNALSGCEDPRITKIDDRLYMLYTAYDSFDPPRVALTSIKLEDFRLRQWLWTEPILISPERVDDKNACIFPEKIQGKYIIFHRIEGREIAIDFAEGLAFGKGVVLEKEGAIYPREGMWDSEKIGIAGPPIKTDKGWFLIYHGVSSVDKQYRLGFMLLASDDPTKVLYRTPYPILEPTEEYEKRGFVDNVVFSCGSVVVNNFLYVYYGGADKVVCLATANMDELLQGTI